MTHSEATKKLTLEILENTPTESPIFGHCCLKPENGKFERIKWKYQSLQSIVRKINSNVGIANYPRWQKLVETGCSDYNWMVLRYAKMGQRD
ncbi:MAG: hypothetical protein N3A69_17065 [Leptospiraceae bacterium]|nr:hypothetical protein [Leptospiraceae bacterium]